VNRFERPSANITLKSALAILGMLGLVVKPAGARRGDDAKGGRKRGSGRIRQLKRDL